MAQRLKFLLNSENSLWYDGRCGRFENFESARHFRIESEASDSNSNRISNIRRSLVECKHVATLFTGEVGIPRKMADVAMTMMTTTIMTGGLITLLCMQYVHCYCSLLFAFFKPACFRASLLVCVSE